MLIGILLLAKAADFALGRWELVYSTTGTTFGANYTDVHVTLPVLTVLAIVSIVTAVLCFVNVFRRNWKMPLAAVVLLFAVWLVGGKIVPARRPESAGEAERDRQGQRVHSRRTSRPPAGRSASTTFHGSL